MTRSPESGNEAKVSGDASHKQQQSKKLEKAPKTEGIKATGEAGGSQINRGQQQQPQQQGLIALDDMRPRKSYSDAARSSAFPNELDMGNREESAPALPPKQQIAGPDRPPKVGIDEERRRQSHIDEEDGGDLALLGEFTRIEHDDFLSTQAQGEEQQRRQQQQHLIDGIVEVGSGEMMMNKQSGGGSSRGDSIATAAAAIVEVSTNESMFRAKERAMQSKMDQLRKKVQMLSDQNDILEGRNKLQGVQIEDMKRKIPSLLQEVGKDSSSPGSVEDAFSKLHHENRILKESLRDAEAQVFSLQPYRKEPTPEEVGREYDDLVEKVTDWVSRWMTPYTDDMEHALDEVLLMARKKPMDCAKFKKTIHQYPDLVHGSRFPETDEDICVSMILRFLNDNIFQKTCYGCIGKASETLNFIEVQMQTAVEPKRDLFSVRSWVNEAYHAILSSPDFSRMRHGVRHNLSTQLADMFRVFCQKDRYEWFVHHFASECVGPAMSLYEKTHVSVNHYYLDMTPFIVWGVPPSLGGGGSSSGGASVVVGGNSSTGGGDVGHAFEHSAEFIDSLRDLDCRDLLKHRKAVNLDRMSPSPSRKDLYEGMTNVCTVAPALVVRKVGRHDAVREPVVVRRQRMLVAWGDDERKGRFVRSGDRTLVAHVLATRGEKSGIDAFVGSLTSRFSS